MSVINKDQEVANEGRRQPLPESAEAPLRDQIVDKLYRKVTELEVGQKVDELWRMGNADRADSLERQKAYLAAIDDFGIPNNDGPYSGSSQVHLPVAFTIVKTFHARMFQAVMGVDPPFFCKARNLHSRERVQTVSDTLRYYVADGANYGKGIEETVDRWLWDWIATGVGIKKWRWDVRYARYVDVVDVPEKQPSIFVEGPNGTVEVPQFKMVEKEVPVTKKCFEGPVCDLVDYEDIVIVGGDGDPDLADAVIHRQFLTASELWTLADRKVFKADVVEDVIKGGPTHLEGALSAEIKTQRRENAGGHVVSNQKDLDRYEIAEAYLRMDVDGSGINSEIIVWVHLQSRKILRATYLYRVSKAGERPFSKITFQPRKGQESAAGLVELVYPLCQEIDAIHNMRIDWGIISVMPFGFYRAGSSIDPKTIQLEPGALIPMDNPQQDVYFPQLGNRTVFGFQEEQALYTAVERLTSISDLNLGVMNGNQGATRTATGSRALVGEMSSNLDVYLKRLNRGWKKSLRTLLHMLQQRIEPGLSFRLTGDDGQDYWRQIRDARELEGDFDIEVLPNSQSSNQQILIDTALQVMQATANPLDIQLGIVGPQERYEALKNYYQALGIKDWGRYVGKVDPALASQKLTPVEEADLVLNNIRVPLHPAMDHDGFIAFVEMVKKDEFLNGQFKPEQIMQLEQQARRHMEMKAALEQMAAQQANTAQMRSNAAQSSQQTAPGMPANANPTPGAA